MRKFIYTLCLMGVTSLGFLSCIGSDKEVDIYDEACISSVSITAMNKLEHTLGEDWQDSTYKVKVTSFPTLTIDQKNYKIYNTDSLPFESVMDRILLSIEKTSYSGAIVIRSIDGEDMWKVYSSTDSIDFSKPREFRVLNTDGSKYRSYQVNLVAHQVPTNKIRWKEMPKESYPAAKRGSVDWEKAVKDAGLAKFIGEGIFEAYAFRADGQIMVSTDKGITWKEDQMDEDKSLAPFQEFRFLSIPFAVDADADYQLLIGTTGTEEDRVTDAMTVWRKIAEYDDSHRPSKWVLMPLEEYNKYYLPLNEKYSLLSFNNEILAVSNKGTRVTRDGGLTWKMAKRYELPYDNLEEIVATTDDEDYIWIKELESGSVWRGTYVKE